MHPFGCAFLGLDRAGVVRRGFGTVQLTPGHPFYAAELVNRSWQDVVTQHAGAPARKGLHDLWLATAGGYVAPGYWPGAVPFGPGIIARLRPVSDDPVAFAVHLSAEAGCKLDTVIGTHTLEALQRAIRLGHHIHRGADGPLTDLQVKDITAIVGKLELAWQFLDDLQVEIVTPTVTAPRPCSLSELLAFSENDFASHRLITHRLRIQNNLSAQIVYCPPALRAGVEHIIATLLGVITAESAITLSDQVNDEERAIEVGIHFRSQEPSVKVTGRIDPLALADPARFEAMSSVLRLVTAAQSRLAPVQGRAWADACSDAPGAACITLRLPSWQKPERPSS